MIGKTSLIRAKILQMDSVTILDWFCAKKRASRPIIEEKQKVLTKPEIDDFGHFCKGYP